MSAVTTASGATPRRIGRRQVAAVLQHGYIWIWLILFILPFSITVLNSLKDPKGGYTLAAYDYVFGSFTDNLVTSVELTVLTIVFDLLISIPAAYALVRHALPAKGLLLSILNLSLYTPGAVMGLSLLITYTYLFHIQKGLLGLLIAYVVGTFPLTLVPIVVALRDLPRVYEEASATLGARRWQTFLRVELPLLGPGISAGILLTFVIVFNEFVVTLFIAGPETTTAALRVYNLTRTAGFQPSTAALAATMQLVSFLVVLVFFKVFGSRYLKGTYLI